MRDVSHYYQQIAIFDDNGTLTPGAWRCEDWVIYRARLSNSSKVADIIKDGKWAWPDDWEHKFPVLRQCRVPNLIDDVKDTVVWVDCSGKENKFEVRKVWRDMMNSNQKVEWSSMVWFEQCIPRHAVVLWLAVQRKLLTQDRIWKPNEDLKCALCNKCPDSHDHLFFSCEYSRLIWEEIQKLMNKRLPYTWDQIVMELTHMPANKNIWNVLRKLVCGAAVYFIWLERNSRLFKGEKKDSKDNTTQH